MVSLEEKRMIILALWEDEEKLFSFTTIRFGVLLQLNWILLKRTGYSNDRNNKWVVCWEEEGNKDPNEGPLASFY